VFKDSASLLVIVRFSGVAYMIPPSVPDMTKLQCALAEELQLFCLILAPRCLLFLLYLLVNSVLNYAPVSILKTLLQNHAHMLS